MSRATFIQNEEVTLAGWTQSVKQSALRDLLAVASRPDIISFALGMPALEMFPVDEYAGATERVLRSHGNGLQYGLPLLSLKRHIVDLMARRGVSCREEQVFLTTGAQHAMSLVAHLLLNPGGQVLLEEVIYDGIQMVIKPFEPDVLQVSTDRRTGIDLDAVEALLDGGATPAFIYAIPDGHNPLGINMSLEKRRRLVELARRYRVPVVEDDAYGFLTYEEETLPPMRAFDKEWVFYIGTFSKILAPSLRVGWIVVSEALTPTLSIIKHSSDLDVCSFTQRAISAFLDTGVMPAYLDTLRSAYARRCEVMLQAMERHFPSSVQWQKPEGGMFVWAGLPEGANALELLRLALETEKTAFIPGNAFCLPSNPCATNWMRLNFSHCPVEQLEEGIARLGRAIRHFLEFNS